MAELFGGWFTEEAFDKLPELERLPEEGQSFMAHFDSSRPGVLRYHGVMTVSEARVLLAVTETEEGRRAARRLYARSAGRGLGGSEWKIMTRRGAAAPSPTRRLEAINPEG